MNFEKIIKREQNKIMCLGKLTLLINDYLKLKTISSMLRKWEGRNSQRSRLYSRSRGHLWCMSLTPLNLFLVIIQSSMKVGVIIIEI